MRRLLATLALAAALCDGQTAAAAPDRSVRIAIVPVPNGAGAPFEKSIQAQMAHRLRGSDPLVPQSQVGAALRKVRRSGRKLLQPETIGALGRTLSATHLLVFEAIPRGHKEFTLHVALYDSTSAEPLLALDYELRGARLEASYAQEIAAQTRKALALPAPVPETSVAPAAPATESAGGAAPASGWTSTPPTDAATPPPAAAPAAPPAAAPATTPAADAPAADKPVDVEPSVSNSSDSGSAAHHDAARAGLRLAIGSTFLRREATLTTTTTGVTPPCYCSTTGGTNPFFPALQLSIEVFPLSLTNPLPAWWRNFGVFTEMFFSRVTSEVDSATPQRVVSNVLNLKFGVAYRHVFWTSRRAIDMQLGLGYTIYQFPISLNQGGFPSIAYASPHLALDLHVPLGTEYIVLLAGFDYLLHVQGDATTNLLGTPAGGSGTAFFGGLRVALPAHLELTARVRYESFALQYSGSSNIAQLPLSLANVHVNESLLEGMVTLGLVF